MRRWYQVLVESESNGRLLIAVEASNPAEARRVIAKDWGEKSIRKVSLL